MVFFYSGHWDPFIKKKKKKKKKKNFRGKRGSPKEMSEHSENALLRGKGNIPAKAVGQQRAWRLFSLAIESELAVGQNHWDPFWLVG